MSSTHPKTSTSSSSQSSLSGPATKADDSSKMIKTPIAGFKVIESHVRSFVIANYTPSNAKVLELIVRTENKTNERNESIEELGKSCGSGGLEMSKWVRAKVSYLLCVDTTEQNLADAKMRWETKQKPFPAEFRKFDPYKDSLTQSGELPNTFDVVCSFHGLSESFSSEQMALNFLQNISTQLRIGGIFFGTMPDSSAIWTCYLHLHQELRNAQINREETARPQSRASVFFNVEIPTWDNAKPLDPFGSEFEITIVGEEDREHHTLVHFPSLIRLAKSAGLELLDVVPYSNWYEEQSHGPIRSELQHLYGVKTNPSESHKGDREFREKLKPQLELCGLYVYFVFRKASN